MSETFLHSAIFGCVFEVGICIVGVKAPLPKKFCRSVRRLKNARMSPISLEVHFKPHPPLHRHRLYRFGHVMGADQLRALLCGGKGQGEPAAQPFI